MSERMEEILKREINKIANKGDLTQQSLENVYRLSKSLYYLTVVRNMEEEGGYSGEYSNEGMSGEYSGRRGQRRDSRGRYSREYSEEGSSYARGGRGGRSGNYSGRYYSEEGGGGYSGHGSEEMMSMLEDMMDKASDQKERETIQKMMRQIG